MLFKKLKAAAGLMTAVLVLALCGCEEKVVTVSTLPDEEGQEPEYIEMQEFELKEKEEESGREDIKYCAVMIPAGYHPSEEVPGMYLNERAPFESSNIYYTVAEGDVSGFVSDTLTKEKYQEIIEEAFQESGQQGKLTINSFEEVDMDGIPAYKIKSTYDMEENTIQQLTYLMIAENTYTLTYSQSRDDELMADFEISDGLIKLIKDDGVQTAGK